MVNQEQVCYIRDVKLIRHTRCTLGLVNIASGLVIDRDTNLKT